MSRRNPEQDLERLLDDDRGEFGALYGRLSRAEPPRRLDRAILAEASRAVLGARPPRAQRWLFGLGSAAGLVLAAGIAWQVGQQIDSKPSDAAAGASRPSAPQVVPVQPIAPAPAPAEPFPPPAVAPPAASATAAREVTTQSSTDSERVRREMRAKVATPAPPPVAPQAEQAVPAASPMSAEEFAPPTGMDEAGEDSATATGHAAPPASDAGVTTGGSVPVRTDHHSDLQQSRQRPRDSHAGKPGTPSISLQIRNNMQLQPAAWIAEIRRLVDAGRHQQAIENLRLFRRAHPDWPLDEDLRRLDE